MLYRRSAYRRYVAWLRRKVSSDGQRVYIFEVESYRDSKGRVRQRQKYVGRETKTKGGKAKVKPGKTRQPAVEEVLPFGDLALLWDTACDLSMPETISRLAPDERGTPVGPALLVLAFNHLCGRRPLADVATWYERSMLRYWMGIDPELLSEKRLLGVLDEVCHEDDDVLRDKTWLISDALRRDVEKKYGSVTKFVYYDRTQIVYVGENCEWGDFG